MTMRVGKAVAPAIIIAGGLIGLGLYFGLRGRERAAPAPPARLSTERFAAALLEYHRAELVKRCWEPRRAGGGEKAQAKMRIDVTFGADGAQVARGFLEERGAAHPEVTECVQQTLPPLRVPPPGVPIRLELQLALP